MPIIESAKKKMRKDKTRTARNKQKQDAIKSAIKTMRRDPSAKALGEVASALDKAVKTGFIHPNKSSRLKSRLSHLLSATTSPAK